MALKPIPEGGMNTGVELIRPERKGQGAKAKVESKGEGGEKKAAEGAEKKEGKAGDKEEGKAKFGPPQVHEDGSVTVAGKRFKSLDHLQQAFLSKAGDASSASRKMATLERERDQAVEGRNEAAKIAHQWSQAMNDPNTLNGVARSLGYSLVQAGEGGAAAQGAGNGANGQTGGQAAQGQSQGADGKGDAFSWEAYETLASKIGPAAASKYMYGALTQQMKRQSEEQHQKIASLIDERFGPIADHQKRLADATGRAHVFQRARSDPRFSGLSDNAVASAVVQRWQSGQFAPDTDGLRAAYLVEMDKRSADDYATGAGEGDLDMLGDLAAFTIDGEGGEGVPRPGAEGADSKSTDLVEGLLGTQARSDGDDDIDSIMPSL